jgi:D-alanyl-D-alanine carboxypeptidase
MTDGIPPSTFVDVRKLAEPAFAAGLLPAYSKAIDDLVDPFMKHYHVPALSIAITMNGRLVYAKAFGFAARQTKIDLLPPEPVSIWHRFRIASVSKPITAVAILRLVEKNQLNLTDTVFGPSGILGMNFGFDSLAPPDQNPDLLAQITVQQLLEHTCGGWPKGAMDPMFNQPDLNKEQLISWVLRNRLLDHSPGSVWDYSNFGYCLLGRIIEHVSGQTYADFVQANILDPCRITTMAIAGDSPAERNSREVRYYGQPYSVKYFIAGSTVALTFEEEPYLVPVSRMDSHGGWIATAVDLVRFAVHVDNFSPPPDILTPVSMTTMITPTTARKLGGQDPRYAKGWWLWGQGWLHDGDLPGSLSLLIRSSNGFCWAALVNTRRANTPMEADLDDMMRRLFEDTKSGKRVVPPGQWPAQDLFNIYDDPWKAISIV